MDVRMFTVGPLQENGYLVRREGSDRALLIDPGDEAQKLQGAMEQLGVTPERILLTHTHFNPIAPVRPLARATGAPVYCPREELPVLADPSAFFGAMFGPVEGWEAEHAIDGGQRLGLAGLDRDVGSPPGP